MPTSGPVLHVASWNVLRDYGTNHTYPDQAERLPGIVEALSSHPQQFDFVGLFETQGTFDANPSQTITSQLDLASGFFAPYDDPTYSIGLAGAVSERFNDPDSVILDPDHKNRVAVIARSDQETVAAFHPSHNLFSGILHRRRQMRELLHNLVDTKNAVVMADFNAMPWYGSRRMLKRAGFVSVLESLGYPATFPTDAKKSDLGVPKVFEGFMRYILKRKGASIDDIYIRGKHRVINAGLFRENAANLSDHYGLFASIEWIRPRTETTTRTADFAEIVN